MAKAREIVFFSEFDLYRIAANFLGLEPFGSFSQVKAYAPDSLPVVKVMEAITKLSEGKVKPPLRVNLTVQYKIAPDHPDGVLCSLCADFVASPGSKSPSGIQSGPEFIQTLVSGDPDENLPAVVREMATNGKRLVTWEELGLPGLYDLKELFGDFIGINHTIRELARWRGFFEPFPYEQERRFVLNGKEVERIWQKKLREHIKACQEALGRKKK